MKIISIIVLQLLFVFAASAQNKIPLLGSEAPSFKSKSTNGNINFPKDFGNSWKVLMSHPGDFTPVCTSEIYMLASMQDKFKSLGVKIAVVSTDNVDRHKMWKKSIEDIQAEGVEKVSIEFPLIDDETASISKLYGMLHEPTSSTKDVRGVFIIDPDNVVQSVNFYPMNVGRNMDEIVRVIEALQTSKDLEVYTPANWNNGDDVLVPYKPYNDSQLAANPDLANQFYSVGITMWYKKLSNF